MNQPMIQEIQNPSLKNNGNMMPRNEAQKNEKTQDKLMYYNII